MAATDKTLGLLHEQVAKTLTEMVQSQEVKTTEEDADGNIKTTVRVEHPSPSAVAVAVAFLKNNSITADIATDTATKELADKLAARGRISKQDMDDAMAAVRGSMLQ